MKQVSILLAVILAAGVAMAAEQQFSVKTHSTTSSVAVNVTAAGFMGEVYELAAYTTAGVTCDVSIVVSDPVSGDVLVLATNAVTGRMIWRPRIMAVDIAGAGALVVTNAVDGDCFLMAGETMTATISNASKTNSNVKIRVKYEK